MQHARPLVLARTMSDGDIVDPHLRAGIVLIPKDELRQPELPCIGRNVERATAGQLIACEGITAGAPYFVSSHEERQCCPGDGRQEPIVKAQGPGIDWEQDALDESCTG